MRSYLLKLYKKFYLLINPKRMSTISLSDNQLYPQICNRASNDYRVFNNFRRNIIYNGVLEHVTKKQGDEYLLESSNDSDIIKNIGIFKENDDCGKPRIYKYPVVGYFSPTTLRYIKVLVDLKAHFANLDNISVCEIGVGYGGQCRVINAYYRPSSYCLVDIKPALSLAQRYLDHYIIPSVLTYKTMNELEPASYDLVISNYAFTELSRPVQDVYLEKIILKSKRGYIIYNETTPQDFNSYKADELVKMIPGAMIFEEKPLTHPKNCIIVWGKEKLG